MPRCAACLPWMTLTLSASCMRRRRGQQGQVPGAFDGHRQAPLHLSRHAGAPAGEDLPLRRHILLEALDIFVIRHNAQLREFALAAATTPPAALHRSIPAHTLSLSSDQFQDPTDKPAFSIPHVRVLHMGGYDEGVWRTILRGAWFRRANAKLGEPGSPILQPAGGPGPHAGVWGNRVSPYPSRWEGAALSPPPAGGGAGKPGFPTPRSRGHRRRRWPGARRTSRA